jgi:hypothetical protein
MIDIYPKQDIFNRESLNGNKNSSAMVNNNLGTELCRFDANPLEIGTGDDFLFVPDSPDHKTKFNAIKLKFESMIKKNTNPVMQNGKMQQLHTSYQENR